METSQNKDIVRRFLEEVVNKGNQSLADELIASDFVDHNPLPGLPPNKDGFKQSFVIFHDTFPDMHYEIDDIIAEEDKVVVRWTATGTQKGELMGIPPTGRSISVTGMDIFRIVNNQLAELWLSWDQLGMMQQLGAVPAM